MYGTVALISLKHQSYELDRQVNGKLALFELLL